MGQWNPLHDLVSLQDRMNRLFEDASQRRAAGDQADEMEGADWYPAADVYENESEFTVAVDLPGIDRATLEIDLDENRLTIKGTRPEPEANKHRGECPTGRFLRTFTVPAAVNQKDIAADYKDGVLQVNLPKRAEQPSQRVSIKIS
ncbi:MAG TPA: Hsp20/alpha crystallin family protein [Pyrinomonadaceae bacterium]|nr:Hsp20/alpha crystallin family protein [Pyrinomonadaceae bacterium]